MMIDGLKKKCLNWLRRSTDAGKMTMTVDELKKREEELIQLWNDGKIDDDEFDEQMKKHMQELIQLRKDGKIGWYEFLLSYGGYISSCYSGWLEEGHGPDEEDAKNFIRSSNETILISLKDDGLITENEYLLGNSNFHEDYMAWLHGRKPTEETAEEFKKSREELIQRKKEGKIGWNKFLLSYSNILSAPYIEWLAGHEQNDVNAKNFILSDGGILNILEDYGLVTENEYLLGNTEFHFQYMVWLNGREPTEETAKEFNKIPLEELMEGVEY